ncbi:hypothetical protein [Candidatus Nitrotoga sp. 1052]|uniref:hypothetical protein n=1 Tax=Candidatus Nitrotoga sp. 1052 TaxID=2886964 RepID=UPI001EF6C07C|nr:hypothetical protein [Candidatus Nitrotoga sp. 1052]
MSSFVPVQNMVVLLPQTKILANPTSLGHPGKQINIPLSQVVQGRLFILSAIKKINVLPFH